MEWTPLYNGHYFEVLMVSATERFHCSHSRLWKNNVNLRVPAYQNHSMSEND